MSEGFTNIDSDERMDPKPALEDMKDLKFYVPSQEALELYLVRKKAWNQI